MGVEQEFLRSLGLSGRSLSGSWEIEARARGPAQVAQPAPQHGTSPSGEAFTGSSDARNGGRCTAGVSTGGGPGTLKMNRGGEYGDCPVWGVNDPRHEQGPEEPIGTRRADWCLRARRRQVPEPGKGGSLPDDLTSRMHTVFRLFGLPAQRTGVTTTTRPTGNLSIDLLSC